MRYQPELHSDRMARRSVLPHIAVHPIVRFGGKWPRVASVALVGGCCIATWVALGRLALTILGG